MSSLSSSLISSVPTCYQIECNSTNKQIKVTVGSYIVNCPTDGGSHTVSGLKGYIECPSYDDICVSNDNIVCNDIFSCLTKLAEKDGYNYKTTYDDYEGSKDNIPIQPTEGNKITIFLVLFMILSLLGSLI